MSIRDIDSVIEGIRSGAFLDDYDGEVLKKYWEYKPYGEDFQIGFHKSTKKVRAMIAGNRCGKTLSAIMEMFIIATGNIPKSMMEWYPKEKIAPSNSLIFFGSIKDSMHDEITIPIIEKYIPLNAFGIRYVKSERMYICPKNIKIFLKSYESGWATFQGSGIWYVNLDEEPSDKKIYTECLTRILSTNGYISLTFTPLKGYSWSFFDIFKAAEVDKGIAIFRGKMRDNPYLKKEDIDDILKKYPEHERKSREEGLYTVAIDEHVFDSDILNNYLNKPIPSLGAFRIYTIGEETNTVKDYKLPVVMDNATMDYDRFLNNNENFNEDGLWEVWEEPKQGRGYVIGVDVSSGLGGLRDHSVAHIKTVTSSGVIYHVASLRTNCIKPYDFGKLVLYAAKKYNYAFIICESEGYGDTTLSAFEWYPFQWFSNTFQNKEKTTKNKKPGFVMKEQNRKNLIELERDLIVKNPCYIINEIETIKEMINFTIINNKYDHPKGSRSDGIIASSLCDWVIVKTPYLVKDNRIKTPVNDSIYRYKEDDPKYIARQEVGNKIRCLGLSRAKRMSTILK